MQNQSYLEFITKLAIGIYIWVSTNVYLGAFFVAIMSAFTRIVYEDIASVGLTSLNFKKFFRYFILSLSLAMLMLHIGLTFNLNDNQIIVISAIFAFMSEETLRFVIANWSKVLIKLGSKYTK